MIYVQELFDLKGATLISLSKLKTGHPGHITASTKNIFGLIPDPKRSPKYHDHESKIIPYAILDMSKIYRALFECIFINEGIFTAIEGPSPEKGRLRENVNLIVSGKNSINVDLATAKLVGINPKILLKKLLNPTKEVFGFNAELLNKIPKDFVNKFNYEK